MPTYEYECVECKNRFDLFQSMKDEPADRCGVCGGKVRRLISPGVGIIFKGSGFHVNDYKKSAETAGKSAESPRTSESAAGSCAACSENSSCTSPAKAPS